MSDDVIDLDEAREKRDRGEMPPPQPRTIVRRSWSLRKWCAHRETEVDSQARVVQCRACGVELDPFDVLGNVAHEHAAHAAAIADRKRIEAEIVQMRAEEKRLKARIKGARRSRPAVDGELAALRALEMAVRAGAIAPLGKHRVNRVVEAIRKLDAVRKHDDG